MRGAQMFRKPVTVNTQVFWIVYWVTCDIYSMSFHRHLLRYARYWYGSEYTNRSLSFTVWSQRVCQDRFSITPSPQDLVECYTIFYCVVLKNCTVLYNQDKIVKAMQMLKLQVCMFEVKNLSSFNSDSTDWLLHR